MKPPTLDVIEQQLRALGATAPQTMDERVHQFFLDYWRAHKAPPRLMDVWIKIGVPRTTLDSAIGRLVAKGLLFRMESRGQYVPKVTK